MLSTNQIAGFSKSILGIMFIFCMRYPLETLVKSCNTCWVWSSMLNLLQNNKVPISWRRVELFCLFTAFSYISMDATVLPCHFSWVWSCKVLWNNKSPVSLGRAKWFCWFFACSYLYLLRYLLKLQKYAILDWLSLSDCQMF